MDMMRQGKINCECGNEFYYESIRESIPCMKCGKMNPNNGEPIQEEQIEATEPVQEDV